MSKDKKSKNNVDRQTAEKIVLMSSLQLNEARQNQEARLAEIRENERYYHNIIEKSFRNPFNESFPIMAGFVDHLRSRIDDDSNLLFVSDDKESDYKRAVKINSFFNKISKSIAPNDNWDLKHRHAKINSLFSGLAIYKYWAEKPYKSNLEVVSHHHFFCEPNGGAEIENHLFCGVDNIYKTVFDIKKSEVYDAENVKKLTNFSQNNEYKERSYHEPENPRAEFLSQSPETNRYVGTDTVRLIEWYTTYEGKRYYVLFHENSLAWLRCVELTEIFPENEYPFVIWHTNEDPDVMFSKAPCDDIRNLAKIVNRLINQELYNREKANYGTRGYDPEMIPNIATLIDPRPDNVIPIDTKGGTRQIGNALYEFKPTGLSGTIDFIAWLDSYVGRQVGNTPSSQGASEGDKKVGVFTGEIQQTEQLISVKNKSFRNALSRLGMKFKNGLENNIDKKIAVKVMGAKGVEWAEISKEDLQFSGELTVQPVGGTSELQLKRLKDQQKLNAIMATATVSPQWKDRQILLLNGFDEDEIKDAWSNETSAERELLSEAAQAEEDIVNGKKPKLNRGATPAFMKHIIDFARDHDVDLETYNKLMEYAIAHTDIADQNTKNDINQIMLQRAKQNLLTPSLPSVGNNGIINKPPYANPGTTEQAPAASGTV